MNMQSLMAMEKGRNKYMIPFKKRNDYVRNRDPTPITFADSGKIIFVYIKLDKIARMENELRNKVHTKLNFAVKAVGEGYFI